MFILFASLVTLAAAAPRVLPYTHFSASEMRQYTNIYPSQDGNGDTRDHFCLQFNSAPWNVTNEGFQYVMSMPMPGFNKEDIEVLALNNRFMMRAIHKEGDNIAKSQIVITLLPAYVNPLGRWTYDGVLRIAFPIRGLGNYFGARDDGTSDAIPIIVDK